MFTIKYMTNGARMYTWTSCDPIDALAMQSALRILNIPYRVFYQNQDAEIFDSDFNIVQRIDGPYGR